MNMAEVVTEGDLVRSTSNGMNRIDSLSRKSSGSSTSGRKSLASASLHEAFSFGGQGNVFQRSRREDDAEELMWAAIERLPTYDRLRKGILKQVLDNGKVDYEEVDITKLGRREKKHLLEKILVSAEKDNENFLLRLRERVERVGIETPKIEVRFEHLSVEGDAYVGTRALPTLLNSTMNITEGVLGSLKLLPSKKRVVKILRDVSGILKPSRMTLLLGPPGSGKTTLLLALAGKMDKNLRPNTDSRIPEPTVGKALLRARGLFTENYWYWISIGALLGFSLLFNILFIAALTYLNPIGNSKSVVVDEEDKREKKASINESSSGYSPASTDKFLAGIDMAARNNSDRTITRKGMVLPFHPLSLSFNHVIYFINMPEEMKKEGIVEKQLQLLRDVSGAFRPGILTALVGVSGAGKTTLMDVLAGRKTGGYIKGSICISGYPKNQATFARISGYCEQDDIHSPNVTIYESLVFSAWLRLGKEVNKEIRKAFIEEVMELVELQPLRNFRVGLPGIDGLSTEQRKRLTIAVELVANPSIIFMDEPTTGLDARAAAIVMRTVRNTVDTGRTVVCTIHQPSIDIFEAFDELLLMKRGGQVIYGGPLGRNSHKLIEYFEAIPGVPKIQDGHNPATWMLDISSPAFESQLGVDFAELYAKSELYQKNQELIEELSTPAPGTKDLYFPSMYSQSFFEQCKACFWKQYWSYWRNPEYNAVRFFMTIAVGVVFGLIFFNKGDKTNKEQDLLNLLGAMYSAIIFLGVVNTNSVQPVVAIERTVFYRERAAGMYSELPYSLGQVAIELIYVGVQTFVYSLILFSMIGFTWQVDKFLWFYYFIFMSFVYLTLYGMMTVALTPNHQIAAIVMSFFISFWNLFSGFLIPRTQIPIWWRWYYWASPVAWTIYGLVTSQVGDKTSPVQVPGEGFISVKEYLEKHMGYKYDFLGVVAAVHIAFVVLFLFVFAHGIKFLNFQKR
ncbi:hypothetical protein L6164_006833 [Bauhinia variegata]|uniref:Uncharacterized protein n=1 Tax=Bauhinia variegata TaxID=167791 RepID=A0ACB9PVH4_BAUVA|nr:hypothetical protein L6164_006833 [Bauhinia variegata]